MPAPAFADIGKATKELLAGGRSGGVFQFDPKVSYTGATASGVTFTGTAVQKADKVDATLKAAYSTKKYSADATYDPTNKISLNVAYSEVAPGVKVTGSIVLPDPASAKLGVEYANPYLNLKSTVGLTSAPLVDLAAGTGYKNVIFGGEVAYDTAKSALTKYNLGVGYNAADYQVAALLTDKLATAKLSLAHNISAGQSVGAEIVRKLASADTTFSLGYSKKLSSGALTKFKLDNSGLLSVLYETKLTTGEKVAGSLALQATDLSKPIKYGFALELA